jgi:hypothetical protein
VVASLVAGTVLVGTGQNLPRVTLRITTRLGVETDFAAGQTKVDDRLLQSLLGYATRIPVELGPGLYASVPPWDLKEATFADGALLIALVNGATLKGRGVGSLQSESGQSFGLNTVLRLTVVDMSKDWDATGGTKRSPATGGGSPPPAAHSTCGDRGSSSATTRARAMRSAAATGLKTTRRASD